MPRKGIFLPKGLYGVWKTLIPEIEQTYIKFTYNSI